MAAGGGDISFKQCHDYIQQQRQVCLYASYAQQDRINTAFKIMGLRGTTVLGASGDGGSHWSFGAFNAKDRIGKDACFMSPCPCCLPGRAVGGHH